jgi:predicted CXXCH cytochrome family protein
MKALSIILALMLTITVLQFCRKDNNVDRSRQYASVVNDYVGESACISCHQEEYDLWKGSHHDWAMKVATDVSVLGDFNDHKITLDGVDYHFFKDGDTYMVSVKEIDGRAETYKIEHTFGVAPLQQYITEFDKGKHQVLRASWDSDSNRWYHQYEGRQFHPDDWLHWTEGGQRWNTMCAECHSTNLDRNYFMEEDSFHTTWSSINVSCEGCHGPGKAHVEWAERHEKQKNKYGGRGDTIYHILSGRSQRAQIDQCAPCHARRSKLTADFNQGDGFEEQFILQTLTTEFYHPDGQILEEDYVTGSFLQSKMFMNGVKCNDCHNSHSMELKAVGNALCMQCHEQKYALPEHHFHEVGTESALCINCHMTGKVYMGNDFRRDHSFRNPRPDQSVKYGTPNACTGCHTDQTDEWAAEQVVAWYGDERPEHFSDALLLTNHDVISEDEQEKIRAFISDTTFPWLTRATAIENYSFAYSLEDYEALIRALEDSAALIRRKALLKFMEAPLEDRLAVGLPRLADSSRMVRIAAAQLTTEVDLRDVPAGQLAALGAARKELDEMLKGSADFPMGRLQLGDHYFRQGKLEQAIAQYRIAITMDSLLSPVYPNLATALSSAGRNAEALEALDRLVELEPAYGRGYYLRALLLYQLKDEEGAIRDFNRATDLDPGNFRAFYNLATLYYQRKEYGKAEETIEAGLEVLPSSAEAQYLLALVYREQGREAEASAIMESLNAIPD